MLESLAWKVVGIVHLILSRNYYSAIGRVVSNEEFCVFLQINCLVT